MNENDESVISKDSDQQKEEDEDYESYSDDEQYENEQLKHKLAIVRDSLLDPHRTFGSNSELDKTMSAMGGTMHMGNSFRGSKQTMMKQNNSKNHLPMIAMKDQNGFPLYTTRGDQQLMQTFMHE